MKKIIIALCLMLTASIPYTNQSDIDEISTVLAATHSQLRDVNKDNKINCIDYSVLFKVEWDKRYNPKRCQIIRNYNVLTSWHHLFVRIKSSYNEWVYIEPQSAGAVMTPAQYWGDDYSPYWNSNDETAIWLQMCRDLGGIQ